MNYSIIMPCERNRFDLLFKTLQEYEKLIMELEFDPNKIEFIIVSRSMEEVEYNLLDIKTIKYKWDKPTFAPCIALNLGVKNAKYENIIVTCPEVKPTTNIFEQFNTLGRGNYIAQVWDMNEDGTRGISLVNKNFRADNPGMYFLALFKKEDIEFINGWSHRFMLGYCYDDDSFGERFVRAGLKFEIIEAIQGEHQWHKRGAQSGNEKEELHTNLVELHSERQSHITACEDGLRQSERFL